MRRDVGGVLLEPGFGPATDALAPYLTPARGARPDVVVRWDAVRLDGPTRTVARRLDVACDGSPRLVWRRAAGLPVDLAATWSGGQLSLTAQLAQDRREALLRRLRSQRLPQQLLYLLGIYPSAWVAARRDAAALLHASAVVLDGKGLLVAGPGGVGKSSLAAAALELGGQLVSDNLVLAGPDRVLGWHEPVRLAHTGSESSGLRDAGANGWHGRRDLLLPAERWVPSLQPRAVLLPALADRTQVHDPEDAAPWSALLLALGGLAGELQRWPSFCAALDCLDPEPRPDPVATVRRLLQGVPLYRLDLARGGDPADLAGLVSDLITRLPEQARTR